MCISKNGGIWILRLQWKNSVGSPKSLVVGVPVVTSLLFPSSPSAEQWPVASSLTLAPYRSCMLCMCRHRVYLSLAPCYCAQHHVLLCQHLMHRQAQCTHGCAVVGTTARDLDTIALQKPTHPQEFLPCLWK